MSNEISVITLKITRLAEIVRRIPRAVVRAFVAAATEFLATLTRPEPPAMGSAEDLSQFGVNEDQFLEALKMFMDDRAVRPRRLRERFGPPMGTNLLSVAEIKGFISKPGGRWQVDFGSIQAYQAGVSVRRA